MDFPPHRLDIFLCVECGRQCLPADGCLALLTRECQILAHPTQQYSVIGIELPAAIVAAINRKTEQLRFTPSAIGARRHLSSKYAHDRPLAKCRGASRF